MPRLPLAARELRELRHCPVARLKAQQQPFPRGGPRPAASASAGNTRNANVSPHANLPSPSSGYIKPDLSNSKGFAQPWNLDADVRKVFARPEEQRPKSSSHVWM
ncbi:hypothetical protein R6Z07F_014816 [Ovis aries]